MRAGAGRQDALCSSTQVVRRALIRRPLRASERVRVRGRENPNIETPAAVRVPDVRRAALPMYLSISFRKSTPPQNGLL